MTRSTSEDYYNVIGFIAGTGSSFSQAGGGLDSQVVMVSAYYDGVGTSPDGILYPGANDNASGVATMLELAGRSRTPPMSRSGPWCSSPGQAASGARGLSVDTVMNAHIGFDQLTVEDVIELSGVGAGDGSSMVLGQDSSYRLVQLFQSAADRLGYPSTTRGRGPHYGLPILPGFGGREGLSLDISWDGSDRLAHTPQDNLRGHRSAEGPTSRPDDTARPDGADSGDQLLSRPTEDVSTTRDSVCDVFHKSPIH